MKISVIGCGYLGAVHAAAMASLGHEVIGFDIDQPKISLLSKGQPPFYEPGLPELLAQVRQSGRLKFTDRATEVADATAHFVCVGTPQSSNTPWFQS